MRPGLLFLLLFPVSLIFYFVFLRDTVKEHLGPYIPWFFEPLEGFYQKFFAGSRTLVISRGTAFIGYMLTLFDLVLPMVNALAGAGVDVGELVGVKGLGPILIALGHVLSYVKKNPPEEE